MTDLDNDLRCLYENAIDMGKHFSSLVNKERLLVVTIGCIVLGACGKIVISDSDLWLSVLISTGGLFLVGSIWALANHHRVHTHDCYHSAECFEEAICKGVGFENGAIHSIENKHKQTPVSPLFYYVEYHGTFLSMEFACLGMLIYSLIDLAT